MDRQTLRDWVIRFNDQGPDSLINIPSPGVPPKLDATHRAFLGRIVEEVPIPAVHGVVRFPDAARRWWARFAGLDDPVVADRWLGPSSEVGRMLPLRGVRPAWASWRVVACSARRRAGSPYAISSRRWRNERGRCWK
jgi:hypothetical protein